MKSAFTLDDLISFAYSKTNDEDEKNLFSNNSAVLPEKRIVENIMSYARALCVIKTENAGVLNLIMN